MAEAITSSLLPLTSYLKYGGVAQLGEHLPCKQGVMGSIPIISTKTERSGSESETRYIEKLNGLIAQVVRARA